MTKTTPVKGQKQGKILGIGVSSTNTKRVLEFVRKKLFEFDKKQGSYRPFFITTPNPEMIIQAQKDEKFKNILNSSDLSIPDGVGLAQANKFLKMGSSNFIPIRFVLCLFQGLYVGLLTLVKKEALEKDIKIIKGKDLFVSIIKLSNKKRWKTFLLGGEGEEAKETSEKLNLSYQSAKIDFSSGPRLNKLGKPASDNEKNKEREVIKKINKFSPHILFVAFGAPKQEKWVSRNVNRLNVGGVMVVGGTFRYYSKKSKPSPIWMEKIGLEWIWRLLTEPRRIKRIFTAFPVFPLIVFWRKFVLRGK